MSYKPVSSEELVGLTQKNLLALARQYSLALGAHGAVPRRLTEYQFLPRCYDHRSVMDHCTWMCDRIPEIMDHIGGYQIAIRWLGVIQGAMWVYGITSLAQIRADVGASNDHVATD